MQAEMTHELIRGIVAVKNTLDAGMFTLFLAELFGKRIQFTCEVTEQIVTVVTWRGKEYFLCAK